LWGLANELKIEEGLSSVRKVKLPGELEAGFGYIDTLLLSSD